MSSKIKGFVVLETGFLAPLSTHQGYLESNPEAGEVMSFSVLRSWKRQILQNDNFHGTRRLNLARLNANNAILILQLTNVLSN
jgi:hypothetical protein